MESFYTVLMTVNAFCALAMMLSGIQRHKTYFLTLALLNFLGFFYHYSTWQLHAAASLNEAIFYSRFQTTCLLLGLPVVTFTFGQWCKYKFTNQLVFIYSLILVPLLTINFIGEYPLRFANNAELINYQSLFGNPLSLLTGTGNIFVWVHLLFISNFIFLLFCAYRLFSQQKNIISSALMLYLLAQVIASYSGYKIDKLEWHLFYIGGLPLTIFSVLCTLLISVNYRSTRKKFIKNEKQRIAIEHAVQALAQETSDADNSTFYNKTTLSMQQLFQTKYVFIGLYKSDEFGGQIETLSVANNGQLISNFSYGLKDTPCDEVVGKKICTYEDNVDLLYPNDALLTEMGIKSYVGLPIFGRSREPLGIVVLLHDNKYELEDDLTTILDVFADRIGAELSRDKLSRKLKHLAYNDYITNLPNRASLFDKIHSTFQRNINNQFDSLLILLDLDNFKEVNTIYGYDVADDILKEIGHRLEVYAGNHNFVARNSGDEFAIIVDNIKGNADSIINVHWEAISAVIKSPIKLNNQDIKVECSAGVVIFPQQAQDRYSVIRNAESALQQAKYNGRNQYAIFDQNIQAEFERKQVILKNISIAMQEENQLFMVYQPQTDGNGNLVGAEALIRWIDPEFGFISPGEFIPIVEQTELIHDLGDWIITNVFKQLQAWMTSGVNVPDHVSINVASKQLIQHGFVDKLVDYCHEFEIKPAQITLELTESGILTDTTFAIECLNILRKHGFKIALDDFGTGYSSLSYLKDLPIDIIKIDKSFIDDIHVLSTKQLIQSIISIGQYLHLDIVAEGTETKEQIEELLKLGCNCFQGYYHSKPLKAEELACWKH